MRENRKVFSLFFLCRLNELFLQTKTDMLLKSTMKKKVVFLLGAVGTVFFACQQKTIDEPIVTVGKRTLTMNQLRGAMPTNATSLDSSVFADEYIRRWVQEQVLLSKAEMNLADDELDIEAEIDAFRNSLIVEKYQQKLITQKFNPEITEQEIETYYDQMKQNFLLAESLVKCLYAVVPKRAKGLTAFKRSLNRFDEEEFAEVEKYLFKNALKYDSEVDKWQSMSAVRVFFPNNEIKNESQVLRTRRLYEVEDGKNLYLLLVFDSRMTDDYAPLEYVTDKISTILLNQKKIAFMKQFKTELYEGALKSNLIKYHTTR